MRFQATLSVAEGKRIIAKGIANMEMVKKALQASSIIFKGGTTVSAVAEELSGRPLSISGRITPRGTMGARKPTEKFHCAVLKDGKLHNIDGSMEKLVSNLKKKDVVIIGANAFDNFGNALMLVGTALGSEPGRVISCIMAEIQNVIVAVGLEKFIPGSVTEIIKTTGRKTVDFSYGMAVGLIPIVGEIITEKEAILTLAKVDCHVIAKGGISGAEGATTLIVEGEKDEVKKIFKIIQSVKNSKTSGIDCTLLECEPEIKRCRNHLGCIYKKTKGRVE